MFVVGKIYKDVTNGTSPIKILFVGEWYTIGKYEGGNKIEAVIDNDDFPDYVEIIPKESITIGYINIYKNVHTGELRAGKTFPTKGDADLNISESTFEKHIHTLKVEYTEE